MTLATFFEHWRITENPFRGEEARQDPVFLRLGEMEGAFVTRPLSARPMGSVAAPGTRSDAAVVGFGEPGVGEPGVVGVANETTAAVGINGAADLSAGASVPAGGMGGGIAGGMGNGMGGGTPVPTRSRLAHLRRTAHSDFEKIAGDFDRPATAIVFGEKGSGKTAIRMQLEERAAAFNAEHPDNRCLVLSYDELNPVLDRFFERMAGERKAEGGHVLETFRKFRLVDHVDAILSMIVPRLVNELFNDTAGGERLDLGPEPRRKARRLDLHVREDLLMLQAIYDRPENTEQRTRRLRRLLRLSRAMSAVLWSLAAAWGWLIPVAFMVWALFISPERAQTPAADAAAAVRSGPMNASPLVSGVAIGLIALYLAALIKYLLVDRLGLLRLGHKIRKQVRISLRGDRSYAHSLREVDLRMYDPGSLPTTASDETRYAMLDRLKRVLKHFGYTGLIVIIDRVDEPTLMSGDPDRMQAVIWPLLNNKFLQQPGVGIKMLLPIELRHLLFRESAAFFQEARLDKQNLIERLTWTGAMLYDLCNARLQACRPAEAPPIQLLDLFAEDVSTQDVVDTLDQMHQPRDAFKLLYQCLTEHCSNVTESQGQWRIPRLVLENVRKDQAERVRQLYRGMRPA